MTEPLQAVSQAAAQPARPWDVRGLPFTVVGAARSGLAAANALALHGADVRLVDAKPGLPRPASLHAAAAFQAGTNLPRPGDRAVLSPGIKETSPVRGEIASAAREVLGEIELFYRLAPPDVPLVAITGTDGKSTTTTMLGAIVRAAGRRAWVGGNLGNPLCEALAESPEGPPIHARQPRDPGAAGDTALPPIVVAEVSGFQLTTTVHFRPNAAVVTGIAVDHTDYHGGFDAYQAAKRRVFARMEAPDVLLVRGDDPHIAAWTLPQGLPIRRFAPGPQAPAAASQAPGLDAYQDADGDLYVTTAAGPQRLMGRDELPLLGVHNVANALAAAQAAVALGLPVEAARHALVAYEPLPHRLRPVATVGGVLWVNDSKATNPNAAGAGLHALAAEHPVVLLAGGSDKRADFSDLGALIRQRTKAAVLFGQTRDQLAQAIGPRHSVTLVDDLTAAVAAAQALAAPGDAVLLSPACASYDQFRSFEHRGEVFEALVRDL